MKTKLNGFLTLLLALVAQFTFAQDRTITGTVSDENGPLPGVSVLIVGTSTGTETDFDGNYIIQVNTGDQLQYSFVGMTTMVRTVGNDNTINVTMVASDNTLEEVVVTAYGTQTKKSVTGAVTQIKSAEIALVQDGNAVKGLTGKVAGVQIIQQSGQPGSSPTVRFRGIGSINAGANPLYVVDGVPFSGDVNTINQQDIESMSFLKDAAAAALYGSRGANGVIIITTKKGTKGRTTVSLDVRSGFSNRAVPDYNIIKDPGVYYETYYQALRNNLIFNKGMSPGDASNLAAANIIDDNAGLGYSLNYNNYDVPADQVIDPATGKVRSGANLLYHEDWDDYLYGTAFTTAAFVNVAGGSENSRYYFSTGYESNDGYTVNSGFDRLTTKLSLDQNIGENLILRGSVAYTNTVQNYVDGEGTTSYSNLFQWSRNVAPIYPVYGYDANANMIFDNNGNRVFDYGTANDGIPQTRPYGAIQNPYATALLDKKERINDSFSGRGAIEYKFLNDFTFNFNVGADIRNFNGTSFDTPLGGDAKGVNGRGTISTSRTQSVTAQQLLNWDKQLGDHSIKILLGHESYDYQYRYFDEQKTNFLLPQSEVLDFGAIYQYSNNYIRDYNVEGYLSRLQYNYKSKYFLNGSFRRDGSSVFHPDHRWGNFWGAGVAWVISSESFLENVDWLSELKLKASTGSQGNDVIYYPGTTTRNYYAYKTQYQVGNNAGELTISPFYLANKEVTWETTTNSNFGFTASFVNNRFTVDAEYFMRDVSDMLFNFPLPISNAGGEISRNIGDMQNKGFEVTVNLDLIRSDNFNCSVSANATHYKNEITKLSDEFGEDGVDDGLYQLQEGRSRYDYYMREFAGVNETTGAAQWYDYIDGAGNEYDTPLITEDFNEADEVFIDETAIADVFGGFSTKLNFKNFDLGIDFAYQIGGKAYDGVYWNLFDAAGDTGNNLMADVINQTWTPENTSAKLPRIDTESTFQYASSSLFLTDATYFSLQNINLGYTFNDTFLNKSGISALRIYALANNVYLWSERQGFDPRLSVTGRTSSEYSLMRTVSIGFNLSF